MFLRTFGILCLFSTMSMADVVINEVLYHAPDDLDRLEFIEVTNTGPEPVDVAGWKLSGEISFAFPAGSTLEPGAFAVVAKDGDVLKEFYGVDAIGEFAKSLSNRGGELTLSDAQGQVVEKVVYKDRAPWPLAADGYSASIERICATGPADIAVNWAPSKLSGDYDKKPSGSPGAINSSAADHVPPVIESVDWQPQQLQVGEVLTVTVQPADADSIESAEVRWRRAAPGSLGDEGTATMQRQGHKFVAKLPAAAEPNRLLRFRIVAKDHSGGLVEFPHSNEVRPAFTVYVADDLKADTIPLVQFFFVGKTEFEAAERYRAAQSQPPRRDRFRGGFGPPRGFRGPPPGLPRQSVPRDDSPERAVDDNEGNGREDRPSIERALERGGFGRDLRRGGFGGRRFRGPPGRFEGFPPTPLLPQGAAALIYTDPLTGDSEVFDFINIVQRKSGWKARFHKDRRLLGMSTVNFLYEPNERTTLNEALSYQLYKLAGNDSYQHGFMRVSMNGEPAGYHLYFEQPNGNFFRRHNINDGGDLYKLIWMGTAEMSPRVPDSERTNRPDITGRYEKKSNRHHGHQDLVAVIEALENARGDDATWQLIEKRFEVEQVLNYFAVNSLVSHWDGFFNNYFVYFDRQGTGKWSLYPWDQDSTWSQRGGPSDELYEMPLFFGAEGATPDGIVELTEEERADRRSRRVLGPPGFGRGFGFGGRGRERGFGWWRPPGDFSGPLLANPTFYARFQERLNEITTTVFTAENFGPRIDKLGMLEPEVRLRARLRNEDEDSAVAELNQTIAALHTHLVKRRAFVRSKLEQDTDERF